MTFKLYHDPVRELLIYKFDRMSVDTVMGWLEGGLPTSNQYPVDETTIKAIKAEFTRLDGLAEAELDQEYNDLKKHQRAAEIAGRWYNRAENRADFRHWLKMPYWSVEEGLILLFGYNPRRVNFEDIKKYDDPVCEHMRDGLELAKRSIQVEALLALNSPKAFVKWANDVEIAVPEKLLVGLAQQGQTVLSSKDVIEAKLDQIEKLKSIVATLEDTISQQSETAKSLLNTLDERKRIITALEHKLAEADQIKSEKPTDPRYTKSLHKIIIAVVCDCYGYEVNSKKGAVISDIQNALATLDFEMSDDTIRGILKTSERHVPNTKGE